MPEDLLFHQVGFILHTVTFQSLILLCQLWDVVLNQQALDPRVLDDVPVAPQLVRQPGTVPRADQGTGAGASLRSPRDKMDVSDNL